MTNKDCRWGFKNKSGLKHLTKLFIGVFFGISLAIFLSCEKEDELDFDSMYSGLFPDSDPVNYIFPPHKYRITLNIEPDITYYYTTNGNDPSKEAGIMYEPEKGILLDVGPHTVKVVLYQNGIKADTVARNKYIICSADVINLIMTDEQEQLVYDSRDEKIEIDNPKAEFEFRGKKYEQI